MSAVNPHERKADNDIVTKAAESAALALAYRGLVVVATVVMLPLILLLTNRVLAQLDANTAAIVVVSKLTDRTAQSLSEVERRVGVLEDRLWQPRR